MLRLADTTTCCMQEMLASPSPVVQDWLAAETQGVYATPSHPPRRWEWPWRLVVVDIYGRAGLWGKVASAFDAFLGEMTFPPDATAGSDGGGGGRRAEWGERAPEPARLPLPEERGGSITVVGVGNTTAPIVAAAAVAGADAAGAMTAAAAAAAPAPAAAAVEPWVSVHPSPLAHAITAYLKHGRIEEAAQALSFLKVSLTVGGRAEHFVNFGGGGGSVGGGGGESDGGSDGRSEGSSEGGISRSASTNASDGGSSSGTGGSGSGGDGGRGGGDGGVGGGNVRIDAKAWARGLPDPAWVDSSVRGFARVGRWDLAMEVLSVEVVLWASGRAGGQQRQDYRNNRSNEGGDGSGRNGGGLGEREKLEQVLQSLRLFLVSKLEVKKPASGQVAGSTACLEVLGNIRRADTRGDSGLIAGPARDASDAQHAGLMLADAYSVEGGEKSGQSPSSSSLPPRRPRPSPCLSTSLEDSLEPRSIPLSTPLKEIEEADRDQPVDENVEVGGVGGDSPTSREIDTRYALACVDALQWLPEPETERDGEVAAAAAAAAATAAEASMAAVQTAKAMALTEPLPPPTRSLVSRDSSSSGGGGGDSGSNSSSHDAGVAPASADGRPRTAAGAGLLLRARCAALPPKAVLGAVRRAWAQGSFEEDDTAKERRISASFALYEAGIESGSLAGDTHWASATAGVVDLDLNDYRGDSALPLAALNLVLTDMLRRYAFEEDVSG